ncbi:MAG: hypothetical protein M0017_09600, partial [Desulfobacteraceae bacterium]|nr:hypothetical protein [Desulfobacteraceae bacterium]
ARPAHLYFPELGYWFITVAAITWVGMIAASAENMAITTLLGFLAAGSTIAAIAFLTGAGWVETFAGYLLMLSSFTAFYTAAAQLLNANLGRDVLKVGLSQRMREAPPIMSGRWEPGVIHGQK